MTPAAPGTKRGMIGSIPVELGNEKTHEVSFNINGPGHIRGATFVARDRLVMARGEPQFDEQLVLFAEVSPDQPQRRHTFVIAATNALIEYPDGRALIYLATAISPRGRIAHIFELKTVE